MIIGECFNPKCRDQRGISRKIGVFIYYSFKEQHSQRYSQRKTSALLNSVLVQTFIEIQG